MAEIDAIAMEQTGQSSLVRVETPLCRLTAKPEDVVERGDEKNVIVTFRREDGTPFARLYSEVYQWEICTAAIAPDDIQVLPILYIAEAMISTLGDEDEPDF
jgi:hypothetical protein